MASVVHECDQLRATVARLTEAAADLQESGAELRRELTWAEEQLDRWETLRLQWDYDKALVQKLTAERDDALAALESLRLVVNVVDRYVGCGDNSCMFGSGPKGMGTNGGCRCLEHGPTASRLVLLYRAVKAATQKPRSP
jgi:hypothetical protein